MKKIRLIVLVGVFSVFITSIKGQGFLNLDFEAASNVVYNSENPINNALPDWSVYIGTSQANQIFVGQPSIYASELLATDAVNEVIDGNFSLAIQAFTASLDQTAMVPADAESLLFEMRGSPTQNGGFLSIFLGGEALSYSALSSGPNYILYGANIPFGLAGQTETLSFFSTAIGNEVPLWVLDEIQFSPSPVPEPDEPSLIGAAAIVLFSLRQWGRIRSWSTSEES